MAKRVRYIDENGDVSFGRGARNYLSGSPATAQRLGTRMKLNRGEWFLDTDAGIPWFQPEDASVRPILGGRRDDAYAAAVVKAYTLGTDGITEIREFSMRVDSNARHMSIAETVADEDGAVFPVTVNVP
jgi:hypothetical protein